MQTPIMPHTPEWLAARKQIITATDVARIMGGDGFVVWAEKSGQVEPFAGNDATAAGLILEEPVLRLYARKENCEVRYPMPLVLDRECIDLGASPDAMRLDKPTGIEVKTTVSRQIAEQLGDEDTDILPDKWLWQVQAQAACCEWETIDVACLLFGTLKVYRVARNETLVGQCRRVATEMMDRVRTNNPPPINFDSPASQDAIRSIYKVDEGRSIELSNDARSAWKEYQDIGQQVKELESRRKAYQAQVLAEMQDAAIGSIGDGLVLKRSIVNRAAYTVAANSFTSLRQAKAK